MTTTSQTSQPTNLADTTRPSPSAALTLTNRTRLMSPILTFTISALMFGPLVALALTSERASAGTVVGTLCFAACVLASLWSAWRAPYALTLGDDLRIRRPGRERRYALGEVKSWRFSVPDGLPITSVPSTNALLHLTLRDRTHFRAEVTVDEAHRVVEALRGAAR